MSLYPGIAAVIDIDKLSSFRSEFGPETLHLAECHLLYFVSTPFFLCFLQARTEIIDIIFILGLGKS